MKRTANIATYPPRLESLRRVLSSIYNQFDVIRIYFNEYKEFPKLDDPQNKIQKIKGDNLTDNGKFAGLDFITSPEYYFTLDDDLIYPKNYAEATVISIETFGMIVTYHGRKLQGLNKDYYRGHKSFHCLGTVDGNFPIDVAGTGVTAFSTEYFHPIGLSLDPRHLMSDLIFSEAAAEKGKRIGVMAHEVGWIKHIDHEETIFSTESKGTTFVQNAISDKIYKLNNQ